MKNTLVYFITLILLITACQPAKKETPPEQEQQVQSTAPSQPKANLFLSDAVYGQTHFNPAQTDAIPYSVPKGTFQIDISKSAHIPGGPVNITTLSSTEKGFMWAIGTDRIAYVDIREGKFESVASTLLPDVSPRSLQAYYDKKYLSVEEVSKATFELFGQRAGSTVLANGMYTLVDKDNILYVNVGTKICAYGLKDVTKPADGIELKRQIQMADFVPAGAVPGLKIKALNLLGMGMTYDGFLVVGALNGIAVIDREFTSTREFYSYSETEFCSNSFSIDENNGIYTATGSFTPNSDGFLRKLVWKNGKISDSETDGAWKAPYSCGDWPPAIKGTTGTGSTPTLMGFGPDEDKLVVIPDGSNRANLIAFWRDEIPADFQQKPGTKTNRIADIIPITCGLTNDAPWIQTEQSLVVSGNGVFFVNNMPKFQAGEKFPSDRIVEALSSGPILEPPYGMERFEWNSTTNSFKSAWSRNDVNSTTMVPIVSEGSQMVMVSGYLKDEGWVIHGLDWKTGETVHKTAFGDTNYANGAYALLQYFENGDLLFNSIAGPYRVKHTK